MKVVCDTSPVCYLLLIGEIDLLPSLFERIHIPETVAAELRHPKAPPIVRSWTERPPGWLVVATVPAGASRGLERLEDGEVEAILLAEDIRADLVVLDDRQAREAAAQRGLEVTGLLGILGRAAKRDLVVLPEALERLRRTNFRVSPQFLKAFLERNPR